MPKVKFNNSKKEVPWSCKLNNAQSSHRMRGSQILTSQSIGTVLDIQTFIRDPKSHDLVKGLRWREELQLFSMHPKKD